jgi:putative membrane protein insertion efficiency factor
MTARLLAGLVRVYQWVLSPLLGDRCKYHPTCSQYAIDALHEHGAARGTVLAAWRVLRCNPWSAGGVDHARDQTLFRRGRHA